MASASKPEFAAVARRAAADAGFDLCGVVAYPFPAVEHFERWIDSGAHGEMAYLAARNEAGELRRQRLETALPWARSVVVCALNYNPDAPYSTELHDPNKGWISRYALAGQNGKCTDYHDALFGRLRQIEEELHATFGDFHSRSYVDTGPIVERALAQAAGIGWIGKNTCLINERHRLGSWLVLGVIVTGYEIEAPAGASAPEPDSPAGAPLFVPASGAKRGHQHAQPISVDPRSPAAELFIHPDRCGSCTRCLDACPTTALIAPGQMDARRCIAYLTIEKRGAIDEEFRPLIGNNVFGCDICQDVCPWNNGNRAPITTAPDFQARLELIAPDLEYLGSLTVEQWRELFRGSPMKRTKYQGFLRNVSIAMGNSGDPKHLPRLRGLAASEDPVISEHAQWAIRQIRSTK